MARRTASGANGVTIPTASFSAAVVRVFGDYRFHTDGELQALAFADDGTLWSLEEPGVLRQWDTASGRQTRWNYLSDLETLWEFGPDARVLASASDDLSLWDVALGEVTTVLAQPSWVTAVALGPGRVVATGHDDGVARLWDAAGERLVLELRQGHDGPISAVAFSADGKRLATAGEDRLIRLWEVATGRLTGTLAGHTDRIQALAWLPDDTQLVSAGWDTTARLWDTTTCMPIILLNSHADQVTAMALARDGRLLACADSAGVVRVWDVPARKERHVLRGHKDEIRCLAFSPDGSQLASGGAERMIYLWDPQSGQLRSGEGEAVLSRSDLAVAPDGSWLASTCGGTGLRVWDVATGRPAAVPEGSHLQALAVSPDGRWLAAGGPDRRIEVWKADGQPHATFHGQNSEVTALAFSPDSRFLASASATDGLVWLWEVAGRTPALVIPEAADNCVVESVAFDPAGKLLAVGGIDWMATGGSDGAIGLWDLTRRVPAGTLDAGTTCVAFHPSGRWLASASLAQSVCVWDMARQVLEVELTGHESTVTSVAYSPDGRWLASGGDDRVVRLWDAQTHEPAGACELDTQIKALCFSPDGRFLYTANGNTTSYQLEVARLVAGGQGQPGGA